MNNTLIPGKHTIPPFKDSVYKEKYGNFVKAWKWVNNKGEWIYCTVCFQNKNERIFLNFIYDNKKWKIQSNYENSVLYALDKITSSDLPIVIVDDELSVDILNKTNEKDFIFTTWAGNVSEIGKTDFTCIEDRKVYYFSSSYALSKAVRKYLSFIIDKLIIVNPIVDRMGWNIADDLEKLELGSELIKAHIINLQTTEKENQKIDKQENIDEIRYPFKILGFNDGQMFFLPDETGQIFKVKQGSLNSNHLLQVAPLGFWQNFYGSDTKKGVNVSWLNANDDVIRACNAMGPFNHNNIRGRGVWREKKDIIIHTGKFLIKNDKKIDISNYELNGFVYERLPELKLNIEKEKLKDLDLKKIIDCFRSLSVETRLQLNYLIGWCVLAPFCGALEWRPHIWITGPAGSGKTATLKMIAHKMLGPFKMCPKGNSSAAGILQALKNDGLAIVHDEAETANWTRNNIEAILDIARSASNASDDEKLMKGTADQTGRVYKNNSMFCFASINTLLNKKSDRSRFSIINMTKNLNIAWKIFKPQIIETFSESNCEKIRARTYYNWPTIQDNIDNFRFAAGDYLCDQRQGDQIGTLLAGAASLLNLKKYSYDMALKICEKYLVEYNSEDESILDELECLMKILTAKIRYINYNERTEETTLLNLINRAAGNVEDDTPDVRAKKELYKYGINYNSDRKKIYIASNYEWIKNILKDTPWMHGYAKVLMRLDFVEKYNKVCYFGSYYNGRAIEIDAKYVLRLSDDNVFMEAGF